MACKELMICLFLLNEIMLTRFQLIHDQQDRCSSTVVNDLLLKVREMQVDLIAYREQSIELQDRIRKVENDYSAYRNESMESERRLQDRLSEMEQDYSAYRNETAESERRLQKQITQLTQEFAEYKNESMDNQATLEDELKRQDTTIGFTAQLTSALSDHQNKPVIYDLVQTNMGSGYNRTTGIFTAPVDGTYVFIWHVITHTTGIEYCYLYLYRNGAQLQFTAYADVRGRTDGNDAGSNSAILILDTGDNVGIRTGTCAYFYERPFTSFSGFKI